MKIAVTGATGFVGQMLVPLLEQGGLEVLVCGRSKGKLKQLFPTNEVSDYAELDQSLVGCDTVLHLAGLTNNKKNSEEDFNLVNVNFAVETAIRAKKAGVKKFIFRSSSHAIQAGNSTGYAESKRAAVFKLSEVRGLDLTVICLPLVFGTKWSQQLDVLNYLWPPLAKILFHPLAAMKPTLNVHGLAKFVSNSGENFSNSSSMEIVLAEDMDKNIYYLLFRKSVDLALCFLVVFGLSWFLLIIWALIKIDSSGPGLFAQTRVGQFGKKFTCYKLRTMKVDTAQVGTHELSRSEVTRIGRFLRHYKVDELPQVINILKNEMTLVGPRPCLPNQSKLIEERENLNVLNCLPGITGYSQVQNIDMSDPVKLARSDARYTRLKSISLDVKIILATIRGRGFSDKISGH